MLEHDRSRPFENRARDFKAIVNSSAQYMRRNTAADLRTWGQSIVLVHHPEAVLTVENVLNAFAVADRLNKAATANPSIKTKIANLQRLEDQFFLK